MDRQSCYSLDHWIIDMIQLSYCPIVGTGNNIELL